MASVVKMSRYCQKSEFYHREDHVPPNEYGFRAMNETQSRIHMRPVLGS